MSTAGDELGWGRCAYAVAGGVLLGLAFTVQECAWLAWLALIPLLRALRGCRPAAGFRGGWVCGTVFFTVTLYWLVHAIGVYSTVPMPLAVLLLFLLGAVLGLYFGAFGAGAVWVRWIPAPLFLPALWVALEWLRGSIPVLAFPWASLGYAPLGPPALLQIAEVTGVYGLSALLVLSNVALHRLLGRGSLRARGAPLAALAALVVAVLGFGSWRLTQIAHVSAEHHLRVAVVQGNIAQDRKWDPEYQEITVSTYERLSRRAARERPELIVWPETAAPFFYQLDGPFSERIRLLAEETGSWLLFGSPAFVESPGPDEPRLRNRAYLISPRGEEAAHYDKMILVPFGEYVPFGPMLSFVDKLVEGPGMFSPGESSRPLAVAGEKAGPLICYEAIFPSLARTMAQQGASFLINITNDAWFGRTSAPHQHLTMARLRAVETRLPLVRAANTGISAVIHPDGRVTHRTALFEEAVRVADLQWAAVDTPYRRYGDVFALACLALSALGLLLEVTLRSRRGAAHRDVC